MNSPIEELEKLCCEIDNEWDSDYNAHDAAARIRDLLPRLRTEERDKATRHARAIEALGGCVTALEKLYVHADRNEDEEIIMDALAAARAVLEDTP